MTGSDPFYDRFHWFKLVGRYVMILLSSFWIMSVFILIVYNFCRYYRKLKGEKKSLL
jgi:hypothetical protein